MRRSHGTLVSLFLFTLLLSIFAVRLLYAQDVTAPVDGAASSSLILGEKDTLWGIFQRGGKIMWSILAVSVIGMAFFFERIIELRKSKHAPLGFDKDLVHLVDTRGIESGLALCLERQSSLSRVLYAALLRYPSTRQEMEAAVQDEGARLLYDLRRNCRIIGVMSNIAPLLGLLGTVLGLIEAFDKVGAGVGLGKAEVLAGGVAVALLTTAFGLIVAIPLFVLFHLVKGKAEDIVREISERAVDAIISLDRKAKRSMILVDDVEEQIETKTMPVAREEGISNLDAEFEDLDLERSIKTSVATPARLPDLNSSSGTGSGVRSGIQTGIQTAVNASGIVPAASDPNAQTPKRIDPRDAEQSK